MKMKRLLCGILCLAMVVSFTACAGEAPDQTEIATTALTNPAVDSYLAMAHTFIDSGDFDRARSVLEQALAIFDDVRIQEMLVEIRQIQLTEQEKIVLLDEENTRIAAELTVTPEIDIAAAMEVDTSMIQPLQVTRKLVIPTGGAGIAPYSQYYWFPMPLDVDISDKPALAYSLTFSDVTEFPENMPASFDTQVLLEWGKNPGLNMDVLHELGYTGKGAVIAYVDQPIGPHEEYAGDNFHYTNNSQNTESMHGPAVLSLLAGKEIGTAPEAEVYFYGHSAWNMDQTTHAECLYQIIEQNKQLPEDKRITMVGFSDNPDPNEKNLKAFQEAIASCEEAGIMVWFCASYGSMVALPLTDKDDFGNYIPDHWSSSAPELVYVPSGSRTTAAMEKGASYIYWSSGGLSWTMPYVLGLYAIVTEIDPSLTKTDLEQLIVRTAHIKGNMRIVNPVEFVAAALEGVGRTEDAAELRIAAAADTKYTYAIMNKSKMTAEDIAAAEDYLKDISDSQVLVVDAAGITSAQQLYTILQADNIQRGGQVVGIQIFGDPTLVPSFEIGYKTQYINYQGEELVDDAGSLLTDLFYGNFNNLASDLGRNYNVMDHFAEDWQMQLVPEWKVARLPLVQGEFAPFLEKYAVFVEETGLARQDLVNFSNPIFANSYHIDDMGTFLNRMGEEFDVDLGNYRLYGNLEGQFPVTTEVLGGFTAENLGAENAQGICEFLINTHGQQNNVDKCWYENMTEKRQSLFNVSTIDSVFGENPYYLDMWTCNNGWDMRNNLTTAALRGNCVGVFSATHVISNNGVDCAADLEKMTQSNFYYFYLHYLNALSHGASRSDAFFEAQRAYGNALIVASQYGVQSEGNYQFNLCNLLGYHNFGLIEPTRAYAVVNSTIS